MVIRCITDDDKGKWGKFIQGIKVAGGRDKIIECAEQYDIDEIIIAMPSISRSQMSSILDICKETNCKLRSLPGMYQLVNGEVSVSKLRDVKWKIFWEEIRLRLIWNQFFPMCRASAFW